MPERDSNLVIMWVNDQPVDGRYMRSANKISAGAYQMEPPSRIKAFVVNPFPSRFINRTNPWGGFAR